MTSIFPVPPAPTAAIADDDRLFPIRRVYCVGRNYAAHAREMGGDERDPPFFFTKFPDAVVPSGSHIPYPPMTADLHHEAELVIAIGQKGRNLSVDQALSIVYGYATGLDMTRRDLQFAARDKGRPWDMGKNFEAAAPLGLIHPASAIGHPSAGRLALTVNGELRQEADLSDMIWNCAEVIAHLSRYGRLLPGDLIYTGTPAGVGLVCPGDLLEVTIDGLSPLNIGIAADDTLSS